MPILGIVNSPCSMFGLLWTLLMLHVLSIYNSGNNIASKWGLSLETFSFQLHMQNQLECTEIVSSSNNNNSRTIPIYLFHRWIHTCSFSSLSPSASNAGYVMYVERFYFLYCEPGSMPDLTKSTADSPSYDSSPLSNVSFFFIHTLDSCKSFKS